jgi:hypothetical protein
MGSKVAWVLGKKSRINKAKTNNCIRQNLRVAQISEFATGPYSEQINPVHSFMSYCVHIVAQFLKARIVEAEKQPLLGNSL